MTPAQFATPSMLTPPPTPAATPTSASLKLGRVCLPCRLAKRGCHIATAPTSSRASCSGCAARTAKLTRPRVKIEPEEDSVELSLSAPTRRRVSSNLPSSTEFEICICRLEMSSVLLYHLVHCSADAPWGFTNANNGPAFLAAEQLEKVGLRIARLSAEAELRIACLVATGARRTRHSAIVGSSNARSFSDDDAGKRREAACQHFADRAVACARACGVFKSGTLDGVGGSIGLLDSIDLLDFLKNVIHRCSPGHFAMMTIIVRLHKVRFQILQDPDISDEIKGFCREHDVQTIPVFDAFHVLSGGATEFAFSHSELKEHYGWSPARAGEARAHLEYLTPREWDKGELDLGGVLDLFYDVFLFAMRLICLVRRHVLYLNNGIDQILVIFDSVYAFMNSKLAQLAQLFDEELLVEGWGLTLEGLSHSLTWALSYIHDSVTELNLASAGVLLEDPSFRASATKLDILFLKGLKFLIRTPPCVTAKDGNLPPAKLHHLACVFARFSPKYGWVRLAVTGAWATAVGGPSHPLASTGFSIADCHILLVGLQSCSAVFGVMHDTALLLQKDLEQLERVLFPGQEHPAVKLARGLVAGALDELEARGGECPDE